MYFENLPKPARAAIFDLDGVLIDSEPAYTAATQAVCARFGKQYTWELKRQCMGRAPQFGAELVVEALGLPLSAEEYLKARTAELERSLPGVAPMAGAEELVDAIGRRAVPMALATSSDRYAYELKVGGRDWFGHFLAVVCGDDGIGAYKPSPDIFLHAAAQLRADPIDCVVFEDSHAGVQAALAAGMQVIAIPHPNEDMELFSHATAIAKTLLEIDPARVFG